MDRRIVVALIVVGFFLLLASEELPLSRLLVVWLVFAGLCYGIWAWSNRPPNGSGSVQRPGRQAPEFDMNDPRAEQLREIEAMPIEAARLRIETELPGSTSWKAIEQTEDAAPRLRDLTPNQRWFFTRFGGIEALYGTARLCRDDIQPFRWPANTVLPFGSGTADQSQPFLRIGVDFEDNPILAKRGEETVYVVHGTRGSADRWWCSDYPSLFHWILTTDRHLKA